VLYDSAAPSDASSTATNGARTQKAAGAQAARQASAAEKHHERKSEVITELMFGTIPLSYRGTSVRVHPLQDRDHDGTRTFLFTKVFSVDVLTDEDGMGVGPPSTGTTSLSSSWGSTSNMREYPFPSMTPLNGSADKTVHPASRASSRDRRHPQGQQVQRHHQRSGSLNNSFQKVHAKRVDAMHGPASAVQAMRGPSSLRAEVESHVPFQSLESRDTEEDAALGWLPSPGPYLLHRRRSLDTTGSYSPSGSSWCGSHATTGRYQPATCAVSIIFSVPGTGQEEIECARLSRYWTMLTRSAYALQRTTYEQLSQHFSRLAEQGAPALATPSSTRTRCGRVGQRGEPQVYLRGKKY
jgi:hypothetical protein